MFQNRIRFLLLTCAGSVLKSFETQVRALGFYLNLIELYTDESNFSFCVTLSQMTCCVKFIKMKHFGRLQGLTSSAEECFSQIS